MPYEGSEPESQEGAPHEYRGLQRWEPSFRAREAAPREMTEGKRRPQDPGDDRAKVTLLFPLEGGCLVKGCPSHQGTPSLQSEGRERDVLEASLCSGAEISQDAELSQVSSVPPFSPPHPTPLNTALCGVGWPGVEFPQLY